MDINEIESFPKEMSEGKKWLISSINTFLAGFVLAMLPVMDTLTLTDFRNGAIVGIVFVAARSGIKLVMEKFINWYTNR